jgi:molybdopterin molybdotransferase
MITVAEAERRIVAALRPVGIETVPLAAAAGRVLVQDAISTRTQPPFAASAMDGWAVRATDVARLPARLQIVGESAAGHRHVGTVGVGEAVRIFTGAPVPDGADKVVLQEDASAADGWVTVREIDAKPHIRAAGLDFRSGATVLAAPKVLDARHIALLAAANLPWVEVRQRPRIGILATGDELVRPGETAGPDQIISSNNLGLAALVRAQGGDPVDLGIAPDHEPALRAAAEAARSCDLLVTLGGASVGDHDLVQRVLAADGGALDFWKIAMRPGKPLMFGRLANGVPLLGLPGNPVSALVTALLFLRPAIAALHGLVWQTRLEAAVAGEGLRPNDQRQDYLRATLVQQDGKWVATPFAVQDSSMLSALAAADCLIVRPPHQPAVDSGDHVDILRIGG